MGQPFTCFTVSVSTVIAPSIGLASEKFPAMKVRAVIADRTIGECTASARICSRVSPVAGSASEGPLFSRQPFSFMGGSI